MWVSLNEKQKIDIFDELTGEDILTNSSMNFGEREFAHAQVKQRVRGDDRGRLEDAIILAQRANLLNEDKALQALQKLHKGEFEGYTALQLEQKLGITPKRDTQQYQSNRADELVLNSVSYFTQSINLPEPFSYFGMNFDVIQGGQDEFATLLGAYIEAPLETSETALPSIDTLVKRFKRRSGTQFRPTHVDRKTLYFGLTKRSDDYLIVRDDTQIALYRGQNGLSTVETPHTTDVERELYDFMQILNHIANPRLKGMKKHPYLTITLESK